MASNLTERLSRLKVKTMRGQARITESNVQDMLREVRHGPVEADAFCPWCATSWHASRKKALGQEVVASAGHQGRYWSALFRKSWPPPWAKVVDLDWHTQPPAIILMAGLQGAGKTTTTAKLAKHLIERKKKKVLTVLADIYRPAAIEQLETVTAQAGAEWFPRHLTRSHMTLLRPPLTTHASTTSMCCCSTLQAAWRSTKP